MKYLETYEIDGQCYEIEHFGNKFNCWVGGCGIGLKPSLELARRHIYEDAVNHMTRENSRARERVKLTDETLAKLGDDPFYLGKFAVPEEVI